MTPPWFHYESSDVKFVNNVLHDVDGAAFGVWGGYNILMAHNTAYRYGIRYGIDIRQMVLWLFESLLNCWQRSR